MPVSLVQGRGTSQPLETPTFHLERFFIAPGEQKHTCRGESDLQHQSLPQQDFDVAQDCPSACTCTQLPNRVQRSTDDVITFTALRPSVTEILEPSLQVTCTNLGLTAIPVGIPENTKELYVRF